MAEDAASPLAPRKRSGRPRKYSDDRSSQLARKRETDRVAQRSSRQRVKNRIMMLEKKLEMVQADDKQNHVLELLKTIEGLRQENERLRNFAEKIRCLTKEVDNVPKSSIGGRDSHPVESPPPPDIDHTGFNANCGLGFSEGWCDEMTPNVELALENSSDPLALITLPEHPQLNNSVSTSTSQLPDEIINYTFGPLMSMSPLDTTQFWPTMNPPESYSDRGVRISTSAPHQEKWRICNEALALGIESAKGAINEVDIINTHAAFEAILLGCGMINDILRAHPMWVALEQVVEKIFGDWESKAQKIACMLILHRILMYYANPCEDTLEKLPRFLRPRPSQRLVQHPLAVDFMFWPGLRERLVFSHKLYMVTGSFSAYFCQYTSFHWPLSDNDILFFDQDSQKNRISPLFEKYVFDLSNWTIDEAFFEHFPECKDDVSMTANSF